MKIKYVLIVWGIVLIVSGCTSTRTMYDWGSYENDIYAMYMKPDKLTVPEEIAQLETQIEKTNAAGKKVPPGLHAHLGYLYSGQGNYPAAAAHFEAEKTIFPESEVFINGLLERMKKE